MVNVGPLVHYEVTITFREEGTLTLKARSYELSDRETFLNVFLFEDSTIRAFHTARIAEVLITEINSDGV